MTRLASRTFKWRFLSAQSAQRKCWQGTGGHGLSCYRTHLSDGGSIPESGIRRGRSAAKQEVKEIKWTGQVVVWGD